jgi:hypothetical protein
LSGLVENNVKHIESKHACDDGMGGLIRFVRFEAQENLGALTSTRCGCGKSRSTC